MKLTSLLFVFLLAIACGKKNESGRPETKRWEATPYTTVQEEDFRRDFVKTGQDLIRAHSNKLNFMFGAHRVSLMKFRLTLENVQVTEQIIMNDRNEVVRSFHRQGVLYLYIGEGNLDWIRARRGDKLKFRKLVLHEALELADINDAGFRYTNQILKKR